jgi:RimJ/RimL family protein N-acetyltransferase
MPPGAEPTAETYDGWRLRRGLNRALGKATNWCIADAGTDRALGDVCLIEDGQEEGTVELGYFLLASARGKGAASRAGRIALDHACRPVDDGGLGMRRAVALTVGDNDASAAVLERLGFTEWGREPPFCAREDGSFDDARHWVLLPGSDSQIGHMRSSSASSSARSVRHHARAPRSLDPEHTSLAVSLG